MSALVPNFASGVPVTLIARAQPLLEHGLRLARQVPLPVLRLMKKLYQFLIARLFGILNVVPSWFGRPVTRDRGHSPDRTCHPWCRSPALQKPRCSPVAWHRKSPSLFPSLPAHNRMPAAPGTA